jgi:HAT1-interacting factor 1
MLKVNFLLLLEQFETAVTEYQASLELQQAILPAYDRRIAETLLMIALALEFVEKPEARARAVDHAVEAKTVLLLKKGQLEKLRDSVNGVVSEGKASDGEIKFGREDEQEIENIDDVLQDLEFKARPFIFFPPFFNPMS